MKKYKASVKFIFSGTVEVNAENKIEAFEYILKHFGATGINIQSVLPDEMIPDWDFPVHPEKKIKTIKEL
jgi:hypothetical protein